MATAPRVRDNEAPQGKDASLSARAIARHRLLADKAARYVVAGGGVAIIAAILGILVFILVEVWPILHGARVETRALLEPAGFEADAFVVDEYLTRAVALSADGTLRIVDLPSGNVLESRPLLPAAPPVEMILGAPPPPETPRVRAVVPVLGPPMLGAITDDERLVLVPVVFTANFDAEGQRTIDVSLSAPLLSDLDPERVPLERVVVASRADGAFTALALREGGGLLRVSQSVEVNDFTGETIEDTASEALDTTGHEISALALSDDGTLAFAGTRAGKVLAWTSGRSTPDVADAGGSAISVIALLFGGRALVVGQESGALSIWFPLRADGSETVALHRVRDFPAHGAAIERIVVSPRDKGFFAVDREGEAGLYYSTSERTLWRGSLPMGDVTALTFSPRADAVIVAGKGKLAPIAIDNPHPEISVRALFGKVWYEGYQGPEYIWQSSSGTDDFEPKLSLTPLLLGTLKGTLYSLVLAIPLGVFGAMYASQFMHPNLRNYVKPTVEVMAALPSVVLGFLAGLWLAPRVEQYFPSLLLMFVAMPLAVLAAGAIWRLLPAEWRNRLPDGIEIVPYGVAIAIAMGLCVALSPVFESTLFGGSFPLWMNDLTGVPYDQRNAIVVGLAMGFAVIPIIFSVAEDAFSNVPRTLISGSLALGATRWQTVTQIVLPTASPGIFSAIMIGFGRAVGETMIVLMATGNTPVMSWYPFNGFRTLSANIAVEIPEAPHGGTLYRTLFLAALLLFALTFIINTAAEIVRQRLRNKFANL